MTPAQDIPEDRPVVHAQEPTAWRWRAHGGGWYFYDGTKKPNNEAEPLYSAPQSPAGSADEIFAQALADICDDLGCARDNEAALMAIKQLRDQVEDVQRCLFLFREFVSNNAKVWSLGSSHHHRIWGRVAEALGPINSDKPTEAEYPLVRDAALSVTSTDRAP